MHGLSSLVYLKNVGFVAKGRTLSPSKNSIKKILYEITMDIRATEITTIIGPNGAGKTTLLKLILGLLSPHQGVVTRAPQMRIGYVPQKIQLPSLLPLRVWDFMHLIEGDKTMLLEYLSFFQMEDYLYASMHELSGGELQKILLVHSALLKPDLFVLDEPAQGVDMATQSTLYQFIDMLVKNIRCGVVLVSHDLHVVMAKSHHVYCLNGHICCHGHPEDVRQHPSYQGLFGERLPPILAPYHHHHDHHHHGNDGNPCAKKDCGEGA